MIAALLVACRPAEPPPQPPPQVCREATAPAPGPLADLAAAAPDPVSLARIRIREALATSDPGFYELADVALRCRLATDPADAEALALRAEVLVAFHRFAEAEALLAELAPASGRWEWWMVLGDARMEQGDLAGAEAAWDAAADLRPGPLLADRRADLAWQRGDLDGAVAWAEDAFAATSPTDPPTFAWVASRLGTYHFLAGQPPNELVVALRAMPDHAPSNVAASRWLIATGRGEEALPLLDRVGDTMEGLALRREVRPDTDLSRGRMQDRRGWAMALAETDPAAALVLMDAELAQRRDVATRVARAWVSVRAGGDHVAAIAEVRAAIAGGTLDPAVLLRAAEVDPTCGATQRLARVEHALLPSERARLAALGADRHLR